MIVLYTIGIIVAGLIIAGFVAQGKKAAARKSLAHKMRHGDLMVRMKKTNNVDDLNLPKWERIVLLETFPGLR